MERGEGGERRVWICVCTWRVADAENSNYVFECALAIGEFGEKVFG